MLARVFEAAGLCTVSISMVREHTVKVKPPRALFVPFPFGLALGKPHEPELQHRVLAATLALLEQPCGPVLAHFPEDETPEPLPQASEVQPSQAQTVADAADEVTALRGFYECWLDKNQGRTAVGLCGIPQRRWRGMIRFLQAYAGGEDTVLKEQPAAVPTAQFIRYCVDDLKAFYYEARMVQRPESSATALHTWFWGETAMGQLFPAIARRMQATEDAAQKAIAYGIAR